MKTRFVSLLLVLVLSGTVGSAGDPSKDYESLRGIWEITAMIDDGEMIPLTTIKDKLVKEARVSIGGQTISFVSPLTQQRRDLLFVLDPSTNPRSLDLGGTTKTSGKGIYLLDGDSLFICAGDANQKQRPTGFISPKGSQNIFMVLKRASAESPAATIVNKPAPQPTPMPNRDDVLRQQILGTWGHQDNEKTELGTFNPDGTFSATRTWKSGFKRVFHEDVRSSGTWKLEDGVVIVAITASTESEMRNQVYSYRVNTITPTEAFFVDQAGNMRREWKVR